MHAKTTDIAADRERPPGPELAHRELSRRVIGAFYRVYNRLGHGFLESVYVEALRRELVKAGLRVEKEVLLDVWDEGAMIGRFRVDLLVEGQLVLEIRASGRLDACARRQLLNYLRCSDLSLGLLLHFGPEPRFHRVIQSVNVGRCAGDDPR